MPLEIRKSEARGHFDFGWLNTYHTFSFGDYHDPDFMGFRELRVINEDKVRPGEGFPTHFHRDMEIITYVLSGVLEHKDSMGNGSLIRPGEVQRMSAGSGVKHSEYNASDKETVHLLQIWILPEKRGAAPEYEQKAFSGAEKRNKLRLIASPDGRDGSVTIHQRADVYACILEAGKALEWNKGNDAWLQLIKGSLEVNGEKLKAGDGAAVTKVKELRLKAGVESEFLFFVFA